MPAGLVDYTGDHEQAQAGTLAMFLGGEERIEDARQGIGCNA